MTPAAGPRMVLLVAPEGPDRSAMAQALRDGGFTVELAGSAAEATALLVGGTPGLIAMDLDLPEDSALRLCRQVVSPDHGFDVPIVLLTRDPMAAALGRGADLGADDFLTVPVEPTELVVRAHTAIQTHAIRREQRETRQELETLHAELETSFEQLLDLLVYVLDQAVPGAAQRGREVATQARELADAFEVPVQFVRDLELAAMLQEIGRVIRAEHERTVPGPEGLQDWHYIVPSTNILKRIGRLRGTAEIVEAVFENWDGSGVPGHLQRGQIPFRSRLLRVLLDFFALVRGEALEGDPTGLPIEDALAVLEQHRGTWYDPAIVARLEAVVRSKPGVEFRANRVNLPVTRLLEGMVLADDLTTASGVKLLSRGATLTRGTLDVIRSRHHADPITGGAWIERYGWRGRPTAAT